MIPLISSLCYGTLEVCQLPRTWWKTILRRLDFLDSEYPDCSRGLDAGVLAALDLNEDQTLGYLHDEIPDYLTFESWVLKQSGGSLNRTKADEWNEHVRTRVHHRPEKITETYGDIGFGDDVSINCAVILNCLQDWQLFYKRDFPNDFSAPFGGRIVPLISTLDYGPLRVRQLPRTWYKILLRAKGLLHPDYPDMTENGLDPKVLRVLNLDIDATLAHIREEQPSYLQFEEWVLKQNNGKIDQGPVEEWNDYLTSRIHNAEKVENIPKALGIDTGGKLTSAVILNHIEDCHYAYHDLMDNQGKSSS